MEGEEEPGEGLANDEAEGGTSGLPRSGQRERESPRIKRSFGSGLKRKPGALQWRAASFSLWILFFWGGVFGDRLLLRAFLSRAASYVA